MTSITSPDGVVLDTRRAFERPRLGSIGVHGIDPRWDITVQLGAVRLGELVDVYGDGDTTLDRLRNLAEIGAEITRQAEALIEDLS